MQWLFQYTEYFPVVAFIALMLAGGNVPISEDLVIITGAIICYKEKSLLVPTFAAIYSAVIIGDFVCYWLGTRIRKGLVKTRFVVWMFSPKNVDKIGHFINKFGIFTFIVCRFIPFGVRNTLFMSSGFVGMKAKRFALYDIPAATISITTLFFLAYRFGEVIEKPFKVVGIVLFVTLLSAVVLVIVRFIRQWKQSRRKGTITTDEQ
jgi:membrane protein DedA with SNARE-associated domain